MFKDKTLLITGGTGSFGTTVLNRFLKTDVKEIRIFSRDEKKQEDLRIQITADFPDFADRVKFYIGDVRDFDSISQAMTDVDFVFHAAALKQVPSCEFYPMEAVKTNVIGTENVLNAAIAKSVQKVIVLSTDKAVYPINAMGISKAMAEKVLVAKSRTSEKTVICATRYGNVMASRGSVIPLFVDQIKSGQPLTVTDPLMTRFLMSLEDSVDLVLYAFLHAKPGDIFVQKAPASTVLDLATALLELFPSKDASPGGQKNSGKNPVQSSSSTAGRAGLKIIGTRHGEKLYESLISREERAKAQDLGEYFRIPADNRDLNYAKYFSVGETKISDFEDFTSHNTKRLNVSEVKSLLLSIDYIQRELQCD